MAEIGQEVARSPRASGAAHLPIAIAYRLHAHVSYDINVSVICYIYITPSTAGAQTPADLRLRLVHRLIQPVGGPRIRVPRLSQNL